MTIKNSKILDNKKPFVDLRGPKGNCFFLLGYAKQLCKELNKDFAEIQARMTLDDYEHLIKVFDEEFGEYVDLYR